MRTFPPHPELLQYHHHGHHHRQHRPRNDSCHDQSPLTSNTSNQPDRRGRAVDPLPPPTGQSSGLQCQRQSLTAVRPPSTPAPPPITASPALGSGRAPKSPIPSWSGGTQLPLTRWWWRNKPAQKFSRSRAATHSLVIDSVIHSCSSNRVFVLFDVFVLVVSTTRWGPGYPCERATDSSTMPHDTMPDSTT